MKNFAVIIFILLAACKQNHVTNNSSETIIAAGKMPAITNDENKIIHLVYGNGDSIMYTSSNNKSHSFSSPELVDTLRNLVASATRGPQIASTKNGVAIIAVNQAGDVFSYIKNQDHKCMMKNIMVYASPDSTVCECCKPSVIMKGNNVYVMFRNWLNGNRDLYVIQSSDGGETFGQAEKSGKGNWALNGCPMDGGGLVINNAGTLQTVWRRESKIYTNELGKVEKEIGEGKGCSIESVNGKNIYAWSNNGDVICLLPDGSTKILGKGSLPLLKSVSNNEVICVWQDDAQIKSAIIHI